MTSALRDCVEKVFSLIADVARVGRAKGSRECAADAHATPADSIDPRTTMCLSETGECANGCRRQDGYFNTMWEYAAGELL
jgi:hypothetical protein